MYSICWPPKPRTMAPGLKLVYECTLHLPCTMAAILMVSFCMSACLQWFADFQCNTKLDVLQSKAKTISDLLLAGFCCHCLFGASDYLALPWKWLAAYPIQFQCCVQMSNWSNSGGLRRELPRTCEYTQCLYSCAQQPLECASIVLLVGCMCISCIDKFQSVHLGHGLGMGWAWVCSLLVCACWLIPNDGNVGKGCWTFRCKAYHGRSCLSLDWCLLN